MSDHRGVYSNIRGILGDLIGHTLVDITSCGCI